MPYNSAIPDRAMPYHTDGTIIKVVHTVYGVTKTMSPTELAELNDADYTEVAVGGTRDSTRVVVFFPELRDVKAIFAVALKMAGTNPTVVPISNLEGSVDSTNGVDGTWTPVTIAAYPPAVLDLDCWRKSIAAVSDCDGVKAIRFMSYGDWVWDSLYILHLYGHKTAGQTADDILFLDAQDSDTEFSAPLNFGDRPAGTSLIRQIKIKNSSATLTASTITLTVDDPIDDMRLSDSSSGPWTTSKVFASLAPNTKSAVVYVKCETDAPPTPLGPARAPIGVTVGSWA